MLEYYNYCELAGKMMEMDDDAIDQAIDDGTINDLFEEHTGRTVEELQEIGDMLLPYTVPATAGISGKSYRGYVNGNCFIVKREA